MTQARPKTLKVMTLHGTQVKEKPFPVERMVSGCQPGVVGGPRCSERDCAWEWGHPRALSRMIVSLWTCQSKTTVNLSLASINIVLPLKYINFFYFSKCVQSLAIQSAR